MVFSSLLFLFRFLPAILLVYFAAPRAFKNTVLFVFSLFFYAWGEPVYVILMLFSTVVDYSHGLFVEKMQIRGKNNLARLAVVSSVVINLGLLGFFKYADFLIESINTVFNVQCPMLHLSLPIGISFYTFQTMSYTIDVYRKDARAEHNILTFGCYVAMFPQLIAGPIVRFKTVAEQLKSRKETIERFGAGAMRFMIGLGKKVLLANNAGLLWNTIKVSVADQSASALSAWLGIIGFAFQIYFDFSGYSDMAIGLGKMFGFDFEENFNYPYISRSITEFWRRWHISLGTWFREYVYIPLGGNRRHAFRNLVIVWFLTGLWHGAGVGFILWGLYFGLFLILEKYVLKAWLEKLPLLLRHAYTLLIVLFSWILFEHETLSGSWLYIKTMFGFASAGAAGTADAGIYYLYTNLILFVVLIIGCGPWPKMLAQKCISRLEAKQTWLACAGQVIFMAVVFFLSLAYLVDATYNPFLYFRF